MASLPLTSRQHVEGASCPINWKVTVDAQLLSSESFPLCQKLFDWDFMAGAVALTANITSGHIIYEFREWFVSGPQFGEWF